MNQRNRVFESMSVWRSIAQMAVPAMVSMLVMVLYNMADLFFVGQLGDNAQVAAVSIVGPVFNVLMALGSMLGGGGSGTRIAGVIVGIIGLLGVGANYPIYRKLLESGKSKYAFEIVQLAKEISEEAE